MGIKREFIQNHFCFPNLLTIRIDQIHTITVLIITLILAFFLSTRLGSVDSILTTRLGRVDSLLTPRLGGIECWGGLNLY